MLPPMAPSRRRLRALFSACRHVELRRALCCVRRYAAARRFDTPLSYAQFTLRRVIVALYDASALRHDDVT